MRASGRTDASTVRDVSARPTEMSTKGNSLLARLKAKVCSRLRRVMFTLASGSQGESGEKACASGLTTASTQATGREARSMDKGV